VAGVAAGCSSGSKKQAEPDARAVPWTATKPVQVVERTPAAVACRAAGLTVRGQVKFVAHLQGGIALVPIRNTSKRACRLTGRPRVRFVKQGGPVQVQTAIPATPSQFPEVTYPASGLLALRPGESADVTISWDNWCDPMIEGKPRVPPSALRITLPGGRGSVDADYNAVPPCLDPNAPSTIGVSPFQPDLVPPAARWTDAFVRASAAGGPIHGRRGGLLRFEVVLENMDNVAATFDRCPAYVQQLAPRGDVEVYELNCKAAHAIAPGKKLAFAMRLRVPKDAPVGPNGLFWELDPFGARGPQLHVPVTIDG
jgi:hypothetical protein